MRKAKSDERALWHQAMRGVKQLREEHRVAETVPDSEIAIAPERPPPIPSPARGGGNGRGPAAIDRRTAQRLKRGQMPIEARLDLHGRTQTEAHEALARFIARSHAAGLRAVIVITGKSGVLHGAVPRWLEEGGNRARILTAARAHAQHGGAGALYLLLRRQR
jgi:DNA-nicking Smr family endonuclease